MTPQSLRSRFDRHFVGTTRRKCVELNGEDLPCYSNKIQSVSLTKCPYDHWLSNNAYLTLSQWQTFLRVLPTRWRQKSTSTDREQKSTKGALQESNCKSTMDRTSEQISPVEIRAPSFLQCFNTVGLVTKINQLCPKVLSVQVKEEIKGQLTYPGLLGKWSSKWHV